MNNPQMNTITPEQKASLRSRIIVAGVLIALILPAFFLGSWVFFGIVAIFLTLAVTEMIRAPHKPYKWYVYLVSYLITFSYVYWFVLKGNFGQYIQSHQAGGTYTFSLENYYSSLDISIIGIAASIFLFGLIGLLDKSFTWGDVAYFITFTLLMGLGFQAFFFCRYYPFFLFGSNPNFNGSHDPSLLWYGNYLGSDLIKKDFFKYFGSSSLLFFVILITTMNDTGAYFIGSAFGKHKMNERISPHKTWEGFFGGWICGAVAGLIFGLTITFLGYPMLPTLSKGTWYWVVALCLVLPLISDLGDLSFSMIKRNFGIKDYGNILKGHGGIVDRVGSDMFTCIFTAVVLIFITNGWNFFA
jgi:CDP-diglyceride synthetase